MQKRAFPKSRNIRQNNYLQLPVPLRVRILLPMVTSVISASSIPVMTCLMLVNGSGNNSASGLHAVVS